MKRLLPVLLVVALAALGGVWYSLKRTTSSSSSKSTPSGGGTADQSGGSSDGTAHHSTPRADAGPLAHVDPQPDAHFVVPPPVPEPVHVHTPPDVEDKVREADVRKRIDGVLAANAGVATVDSVSCMGDDCRVVLLVNDLDKYGVVQARLEEGGTGFDGQADSMLLEKPYPLGKNGGPPWQVPFKLIGRGPE